MDIGLDMETVFIPSAEIREDKGTNRPIGIQRSPYEQQCKICKAVKAAVHDSRILIAMAHSSGSIPTIAALRNNTLQNAVIVSPAFLDPIREIFDSPTIKKRLLPVDQSQSDRYKIMMSPAKMDYSIIFPSDHCSDRLYMDPILFSPEGLKKIIIDKINHSKVDKSDIERVVKVLRSGFLSKPEGGPMIEEFQELMKTTHNKLKSLCYHSRKRSGRLDRTYYCAIVARAKRVPFFCVRKNFPSPLIRGSGDRF